MSEKVTILDDEAQALDPLRDGAPGSLLSSPSSMSPSKS